jgi:predicted RNA methylase
MSKAKVDSRQFDLFAEPPDAKDLSAYVKGMSFRDVLGVCFTFERHHGHWPRMDSPASDFTEAKINGAESSGIDGTSLNRLILLGSEKLNQDPEYLALKARVLMDGYDKPNLSALDPRYRLSLTQDQIELVLGGVEVEVYDSRQFRDSRLGDRMWLDLPVRYDRQIVQRAGLDWDTLLTNSVHFSLSVPARGTLAKYAGEIDLVYGNSEATMGEHYYLQMIEDGRLFVKYQRIIGSRPAGQVEPEVFESLLANAAAKLQAGISNNRSVRQALEGGGRSCDNVVSLPSQRKASLQAELGLLLATPDGIALPETHLHHYESIKMLLEKAGGRYVQNKQMYAFEDGIDVCEVLDRLQAGDTVNFKKDFQFFGTPRVEAVRVCEAAGPLDGLRVLEPSAGDGAIADVALEMGAAEVVCVELWDVNVRKLQEKGHDVVAKDFLSLTTDDIGQFDAICANPPFSKGADIEHVMKMFSFLRPGGSLSAIMSTGWQESHQKKHREFRAFLDSQNVTITPIEAGAFSESGTKVATLRLDVMDYRPELSNKARQKAGLGR